MTDNEGFPLYKMLVNGKEQWLPLRRAGITYDTGYIPVSIGGLVLEASGETREITDDERGQIVEIADEWSASK